MKERLLNEINSIIKVTYFVIKLLTLLLLGTIIIIFVLIIISRAFQGSSDLGYSGTNGPGAFVVGIALVPAGLGLLFVFYKLLFPKGMEYEEDQLKRNNQSINLLIFGITIILLISLLIICINHREQITNNIKNIYYRANGYPIGKYICGEYLDHNNLEIYPDGTYEYGLESKKGTWKYTKKTNELLLSNDTTMIAFSPKLLFKEGGYWKLMSTGIFPEYYCSKE